MIFEDEIKAKLLPRLSVLGWSYQSVAQNKVVLIKTQYSEEKAFITHVSRDGRNQSYYPITYYQKIQP